jgi:hypothetical protein
VRNSTRLFLSRFVLNVQFKSTVLIQTNFAVHFIISGNEQTQRSIGFVWTCFWQMQISVTPRSVHWSGYRSKNDVPVLLQPYRLFPYIYPFLIEAKAFMKHRQFIELVNQRRTLVIWKYARHKYKLKSELEMHPWVHTECDNSNKFIISLPTFLSAKFSWDILLLICDTIAFLISDARYCCVDQQ